MRFNKGIVLFFALLIVTTISLFAQTSRVIKLTEEEKQKTVTKSVREKFNLENSILNAYKYTDASGAYLTTIGQNKGTYLLDNKDTATIKVTVINFKIENNELIEMCTFEINALPDFIVGVQDVIVLEDQLEFSDFDQDSLIEPLIVCRTLTELKLSIIYKSEIISINHHFKGYDYNTLNIDRQFYSLNEVIQNRIIEKLQMMETSSKFILPNNWKKKMKNRITLIRSKYK